MGGEAAASARAIDNYLRARTFVRSSSANILALNSPDNALHFVSALVLLGVGLTEPRVTTAA